MKSHIKIEHAIIENYSDTFKSLSDRKQAETTETFLFEFCDKRFAREDTLLQHKVTHNVVEKIECEKFLTKFSLMKNYKRHLKDSLWEDETWSLIFDQLEDAGSFKVM